MKHDIDMQFEGTHRDYRSMQLFKDGQLLVGDYQEGRLSLTVD